MKAVYQHHFHPALELIIDKSLKGQYIMVDFKNDYFKDWEEGYVSDDYEFEVSDKGEFLIQDVYTTVKYFNDELFKCINSLLISIS